MRDDLAVDDGRYHVAQAGVRAELIFARLEIFPRFENKYATDKYPGLIDDAFTVKYIGDIAYPGAVRDIDNPVLWQRSRRIELLVADVKQSAGQNCKQYKQAENGIANDDKRVPRALRSPWRHIDRIRLERRSRATWRQAFTVAEFGIHGRTARSIRKPLRGCRIGLSRSRGGFADVS
jgi:hypothetical protein